MVSADGISPDPAKIRVVKDFPIPTNVRAVREFVGFIGYYRRFVPNFARVAGPLHMLARSNVSNAPFVWTDTCQSLLTTPPV